MNVPRAGISGWVWRLVATFGLLAQLACTEGYPTTDEVGLSPSQMSQSQLIDALNRLGARPHLAQRWRYAMAPGCRLVIEPYRGLENARGVDVKGASVDAVSIDEDSTIRLIPSGKFAADAVTVLVTRQWTDVAYARSLLAHLVRSCAENKEAIA